MPRYVLLNVGSGPEIGPAHLPNLFRSDEWREIRLDINPSAQPDIVASITDMSCVPSESIDGILSSHNLEHLYQHEVVEALLEFIRVLKPAGFLYLKVPDLLGIAELIVTDRLDQVAYQAPAGPITALDMLYGHRASLAAGNVFMAHHTGFTPRTLERALETAGFAFGILKRQNYLEVSALAFKSSPPSSWHDHIVSGLEF